MDIRMKSVETLKQKLNKLNLSEARKADLIVKYIKADAKLTKRMNDYFGIRTVQKRKKAKTKKKPHSNKRSANREPIIQSSKTSNQPYRGSHARIFDHRARPEPDLHIEADKQLDKEYFKLGQEDLGG